MAIASSQDEAPSQPKTSSIPSRLSLHGFPVLFTAAVLVVLFFILTPLSQLVRKEQCSSVKGAALTDGWEDTAISSSSQGKIWKAQKRRKYSNKPDPSFSPHPPPRRFENVPLCDRWAVVTTIFEPTKLCKQLRDLDNWCFVVIGDKKTDDTIWRKFAKDSETSVYLSPADQKALGYRISSLLPWNHFGRKNIGYLFAIHHGAKYIWDTDDDNELRNDVDLPNLVTLAEQNTSTNVIAVNTHVWNPYPMLRPVQATTAQEEDFCWPRGFPLQFVKDRSATGSPSTDSVPVSSIGIFQSLANHDPDVDAIYRLTKEMPVSFLSDSDAPMVLQPGKFAPLNAQATLWTRQSFWAMIMPITVHGRVTDIWRAYFAEAILPRWGQHVAFTSPVVTQLRNDHSLVADLQSEIPLYTQANALTQWLAAWRPAWKSRTLQSQLVQLIIDLYEIGIVEEEDVHLYQAWLLDLESVGYAFPSPGKLTRTAKQTGKTKPTISSSENVAVCVTGQLRTLTMRPADWDHPNSWQGLTTKAKLSPPVMSVSESMQRNLYPKLGSPDVFMHISTRETKFEPKANDLSVCEPLRPRHGNLFCSVPKEETIPRFNLTLWDDFYRNQTEAYKQGLLQQLKGLFECQRMVRAHTIKTGKTYDWMVRVRPDDYVLNFPSLEQLTLDSKRPTIWNANKTLCCCGNRDWLAVGRFRWMEAYLDRFLYLQSSLYKFPKRWISEDYAERVVGSYGVEMKSHPEISACVVKPLHRRRPSDP